MPHGQLRINGLDAYDTWGVSLEDGALAVLMTPPAAKDRVSNASRLENGRRIINAHNKVESREITLEMHLIASSTADYLTKYNALCDVFKNGTVNIWTSFQPNVNYRCLFLSCTQFAQYFGGLAKFSLRLIEPNPTNR